MLEQINTIKTYHISISTQFFFALYYAFINFM